MDVRVSSRVPIKIKEKAAKELANHGLTMSSFIRMTLSSVAKNGLPRYCEIPNVKTMVSIDEAVTDMKHPYLKKASSYEEVEKLLNE